MPPEGLHMFAPLFDYDSWCMVRITSAGSYSGKPNYAIPSSLMMIYMCLQSC